MVVGIRGSTTRRETPPCCRSTSSRRGSPLSRCRRLETQQVLGAVHGNQDAMDAFAGITAGTVSPVDFFDPEHVGRIMRAAA